MYCSLKNYITANSKIAVYKFLHKKNHQHLLKYNYTIYIAYLKKTSTGI